MAELRWLLLAAGIIVLLAVFWWSRRESSGKPFIPLKIHRRGVPELGLTEPAEAGARAGQGAQPPAQRQPPAAHRIIAVRLTGHGNGTFAGEALHAALSAAGLRHGLYGIFHRYAAVDGDVTLFSVASLVEPGSFDLVRLATERVPGVTFFLAVVPGTDNLTAFDDMMSTARVVAGRLEGELLDERGSRLSVQRERYLREEVIQLTRQFATAS